MARYDRGYGGGWEEPPPPRRGPGGSRPPPRDYGYGRDEPRGPPFGRGGGWVGRGEYGPDYPGFDGYPGAPAWGEYYGYGPEPPPGRGYRDDGYARGPFVPEEAYRRHPEYDQPPREWRAHAPDEDEEPGDGEIRDAVRSYVQDDPWLEAGRIRVEVEDGVVTLTGEVDDFLEARYAGDDAWEAAGVRGVVNHLTVRTDLPSAPHGDLVPQTGGEPPVLDAEQGGSGE